MFSEVMVMNDVLMRRFAFLLSNEHSEAVDGSVVIVRADTPEEATAEMGTWKLVTECGTTFRLIGERRGFGRTRELVPCVPIETLPEHVLRLENVVVDVKGAA
jgi:hypothetical protein